MSLEIHDWQIAVLVCMSVVFIVCVAVIVFLIRSLSRAKAHSNRSAAEEASQNTQVNMCNARSVPSDESELHFLDFYKHLRVISLQGRATLNGVGTAIHSGRELQQQMAYLCGVPDWQALTLVSYPPNRLDCPIVISLDHFVTRDVNFAARMRATKLSPPHLTRVLSRGSAEMPTATAHAPNAPAAATNLSCHPEHFLYFTGQLEMDAKRTQDNFLLSARPALSQGSHEHNLGKPGFHVVPDISNRQHRVRDNSQGRDRSHSQTRCSASHATRPATALSAPLPQNKVPTPLFFPANTVIRADTPIFILAAHYVRSTRPEECLNENIRVLLEAAMCGDNSSRSVQIVCGELAGSTITVSPKKGTAVLRTPGSAVEDLLVRRSADHIRFAIDLHDAAQWSQFTRPFFLPPGRWCVHAKATLSDEQDFVTNAKVYTVESV